VGVVDHDPLADAGIRMDVDAKGLADPHLNKIGHVPATLAPEPMSDAIGLHGLIALEEKDRLQEAVAGRITLIHCHEVCPGGRAEFGILGIGLIRDLSQELLAHFAGSKLEREAERERAFK
jgi:hypothetical protein